MSKTGSVSGNSPVSIRAFLSVYLPTLLVVTLSAVGILWSADRTEGRRLVLEQQNLVVLQRQVHTAFIERVVTELVMLAGDSRTRFGLEDENPLARQALADLLTLFLVSRGTVDRIHIADENGTVMMSALYNRGRIEIFDEPSGITAEIHRQIREVLDSGRVKLTSIEFPNPDRRGTGEGRLTILKAGMPVFGDSAEPIGVLLMEQVTDELSRRVLRLYSAGASTPLLLNDSGVSMITNPDQADELTVMMADRYPQAWNKMSSRQHGAFRNREGIFAFDTIDPEVVAQNEHRLRMPTALTPTPSDLRWKMVSMVSGEQLREANRARFMLALVVVALLQLIQVTVTFVMVRALAARKEATRNLRTLLADVQGRHAEMETLNKMSDLLQASAAEDEMLQIFAGFAPRLFPETGGGLFLYRSSQTVLERRLWWGEFGEPAVWLDKDDCWAFRRGKYHFVTDPSTETGCAHYLPDAPVNLCLPMMLGGEMIGVLSIAWRLPEPSAFEMSQFNLERVRRVATSAAARVGLSLANLRLRETLRSQSIRDALTGVYNRRYLDEIMIREVLRSRRASAPIGLLMFDVDHFKNFNDTHGHEAGDRLLQEIGAVLRRMFRAEDVPCRYGGEEFLVLLPGADIETALDRAEQLRTAIQHHSITHRGQILLVTISVGVAVIPDHADTAEEALAAVDKALYQSKKDGRNRVTLFVPK